MPMASRRARIQVRPNLGPKKTDKAGDSTTPSENEAVGKQTSRLTNVHTSIAGGESNVTGENATCSAEKPQTPRTRKNSARNKPTSSDELSPQRMTPETAVTRTRRNSARSKPPNSPDEQCQKFSGDEVKNSDNAKTEASEVGSDSGPTVGRRSRIKPAVCLPVKGRSSPKNETESEKDQSKSSAKIGSPRPVRLNRSPLSPRVRRNSDRTQTSTTVVESVTKGVSVISTESVSVCVSDRGRKRTSSQSSTHMSEMSPKRQSTRKTSEIDKETNSVAQVVETPLDSPKLEHGSSKIDDKKNGSVMARRSRIKPNVCIGSKAKKSPEESPNKPSAEVLPTDQTDTKPESPRRTRRISHTDGKAACTTNQESSQPVSRTRRNSEKLVAEKTETPVQSPRVRRTSQGEAATSKHGSPGVLTSPRTRSNSERQMTSEKPPEASDSHREVEISEDLQSKSKIVGKSTPSSVPSRRSRIKPSVSIGAKAKKDSATEKCTSQVDNTPSETDPTTDHGNNNDGKKNLQRGKETLEKTASTGSKQFQNSDDSSPNISKLEPSLVKSDGVTVKAENAGIKSTMAGNRRSRIKPSVCVGGRAKSTSKPEVSPGSSATPNVEESFTAIQPRAELTSDQVDAAISAKDEISNSNIAGTSQEVLSDVPITPTSTQAPHRSKFTKAKPNLVDVSRMKSRYSSMSEEEDVGTMRNPPPVHRVSAPANSSDTTQPVSTVTSAQVKVKTDKLDVELAAKAHRALISEQKKPRRTLKLLTEPIDKSKLTMMDLIHMNPKENPMKSPSSDKKPRVTFSDNASTKKEEIEESEERDLAAPQVTIGPDGNIIINESSLVMENKDVKMNIDSEVIDETDLQYKASYHKCRSKKTWSIRETRKFYVALNMIGTDFTMMSQLFPDRSRQDMKRKFKKEEKVHRELVERALTEKRGFDLSLLGNPASSSSDEEDRKPTKFPTVRKKRKPGKTTAAAKPKKRKKRTKSPYYADSSDEEENDEEIAIKNDDDDDDDKDWIDEVKRPVKPTRAGRTPRTPVQYAVSEPTPKRQTFPNIKIDLSKSPLRTILSPTTVKDYEPIKTQMVGGANFVVSLPSNDAPSPSNDAPPPSNEAPPTNLQSPPQGIQSPTHLLQLPAGQGSSAIPSAPGQFVSLSELGVSLPDVNVDDMSPGQLLVVTDTQNDGDQNKSPVMHLFMVSPPGLQPVNVNSPLVSSELENNSSVLAPTIEQCNFEVIQDNTVLAPSVEQSNFQTIPENTVFAPTAEQCNFQTITDSQSKIEVATDMEDIKTIEICTDGTSFSLENAQVTSTKREDGTYEIIIDPKIS